MKQSEMFELRKYAGNLDSLFGYKDYTFNDGPARGMRAFDLRNGTGLDLTVVADRGLDIASMRFKGVNIGFDSKVGLRSPALYVEDGVRGFLKQFNAGMLTTCGITYAGGAPARTASARWACTAPTTIRRPPTSQFRPSLSRTRPSSACAGKCARRACSRKTWFCSARSACTPSGRLSR